MEPTTNQAQGKPPRTRAPRAPKPADAKPAANDGAASNAAAGGKRQAARGNGGAAKSARKGSGGGRGRSAAGKGNGAVTSTGRSVSRGQAIRAQKQTLMDAQRVVNQYASANARNGNGGEKGPQRERRANFIDDSPRLKIIGLGGMDGGGSKNMILVEYMDDAVIMDCGNDLGVDLPGINYGICDTAYLESIKHKLRAYVITHGHLDHIGGLPHIVPKFPAPIYGSKFTIGRVEEIFQNFGLPMPDGFELNTVMMNENTHERLKVGPFFVELVRITHSIPGSTCIVLDTPVGRIINTGDFRFDPNPLDHERSDYERLKQLGDEGVLALLSESTTVERLGRTPSESTIEQSFIDIIDQAPGRIFIGLFSTNVLTRSADHDGSFQFKIQFFKMIGHAKNIAWSLYAVVIRKIEYRVLIELRYHIHFSVPSCCRNMLAKGIAIPATGGEWNRCQEI